MSSYSGKCDIYDCYIPNNSENDNHRIKNTDFYIDNVKTEINTVKQLAPYFPCLIGMSAWSGGELGHGTCHFSSKSYADSEEGAHLKYKLLKAKKAYRKVKRKKLELNTENVYAEWYHFKNDEDIDLEITRRVVENYDGADTRGLTTYMGRHYRYALYKTMVELGYTVDQAIAWVYEHKKTWED